VQEELLHHRPERDARPPRLPPRLGRRDHEIAEEPARGGACREREDVRRSVLPAVAPVQRTHAGVAADDDRELLRLPSREGERAVFVRAIYGHWQLVEQLADFWHNHFNIYGYDRYAAPTWTSWDRDVIRKNMLGNFRQMLQATFEAPAMLYFLDNYINRAPSFNENYAREICELHTLGAINYLGPELQQADVPLIPAGEDGAGQPIGYVDADVYEMARALTGWTFGNGQNGTAYDGHPAFITAWHDIGQKTATDMDHLARLPAPITSTRRRNKWRRTIA